MGNKSGKAVLVYMQTLQGIRDTMKEAANQTLENVDGEVNGFWLNNLQLFRVKQGIKESERLERVILECVIEEGG